MKKTTKEEAQSVLQDALVKTNKKLVAAFFQPLESIRLQLQYLIESLNNGNDRRRLDEIIIGRYAAFEFELSDPEYADILHEASSICRLMKKGRL